MNAAVIKLRSNNQLREVADDLYIRNRIQYQRDDPSSWQTDIKKSRIRENERSLNTSEDYQKNEYLSAILSPRVGIHAVDQFQLTSYREKRNLSKEVTNKKILSKFAVNLESHHFKQ